MIFVIIFFIIVVAISLCMCWRFNLLALGILAPVAPTVTAAYCCLPDTAYSSTFVTLALTIAVCAIRSSLFMIFVDYRRAQSLDEPPSPPREDSWDEPQTSSFKALPSTNAHSRHQPAAASSQQRAASSQSSQQPTAIRYSSQQRAAISYSSQQPDDDNEQSSINNDDEDDDAVHVNLNLKLHGCAR